MEIEMSIATPLQSDLEQSRVVALSENDAREAARLIRVLSAAASGPPSDPELLPPVGADPEHMDLVLRAEVILNGRQLRRGYFQPGIFGEPGWDILLVLYVTEVSGERPTIGRLTEWLAVPATTVMRWVSLLEGNQLTIRQPHPNDRRIMFIRLTDLGRSRMDAYLRALAP